MPSFVVLLILHTTLYYSQSFVINHPTPSSRTLTQINRFQQRHTQRYFTNRFLHSHHRSSPLYTTSLENELDSPIISPPSFNLTTALFCAGLAFDAYSEPSNSSRWEKGPQGLNVAFQSDAYTRTLYNGLLEVQPIKVVDLPDQDDTAEGVLSGSGMDAYLLVALAEGHVKEDLKTLKETYNSGVLDLKGSAHAGRSNTAWSNMRKEVALQNKAKGKSGSYHIKSSWTTGGKAVWEEDPPFYLYVQNPQDVQIVFTVMDDNIVGENIVIGSTYRKLADLMPNIALGNGDPVQMAKAALNQKYSNKDKSTLTEKELQDLVVQEWRGDLKLNKIPRKKDKGGQVAMGTVAGAMVAGPAGAAVGGFLGNLYEGQARGKVEVGLRFLPIPSPKKNRVKYEVKGGLPGVDWGKMYKKHIQKISSIDPSFDPDIAGDDLELCVFVTHEKTGSSCAIYRSLEKKLIAVSFRGTCAPIDLVTDASIVQTPWVKGVDEKKENVPRVHVGFRTSLDSVSRRVKELILAAVAPGESLADYSLIITGHSLGGALATLFATDVAEYGMDAGRGLPQLEPSAPWWSRISENLMANKKISGSQDLSKGPPKPKEIRLYSFGSPRVGNEEFVEKFDQFVKNGTLKEAYRVVNGEDVVARLPRTVNAGVVQVRYDHSGATALVALPKADEEIEGSSSSIVSPKPLIWVEGESDNSQCPVRDGATFASPLADGTFLGDIMGAMKEVVKTKDEKTENDNDFKLGELANRIGGSIKNLKASDLAGAIGIDKNYVDREAKIFQSLFSGEAIGHHMEDQYYLAMGRAAGYLAIVGEDIKDLEEVIIGSEATSTES